MGDPQGIKVYELACVGLESGKMYVRMFVRQMSETFRSAIMVACNISPIIPNTVKPYLQKRLWDWLAES